MTGGASNTVLSQNNFFSTRDMSVPLGLVTGLVTFVIGMFAGALGIYVGGQMITGEGNFERAVGTAIAGALVWAVVGTVIGGIPPLGPILTFLAYLAVLNLAYPGGWAEAFGIVVFA